MVTIKGLYKKFGELVLYEDFNMEIETGKIVVILGPSGCGKSTLLKMIAGLEEYNKGKIIFHGKQNLAYIFQEDRLIPWLTVYENIAFVLKSKCSLSKMQPIITEVLEILELEQYASYYPSELSGGMQRRVNIARAFVYDSDLLLMDEPFRGLDERLKQKIIKEFLIRVKKEKKTVLCITHDRKEANQIADIIYEFFSMPVRYKKQ